MSNAWIFQGRPDIWDVRRGVNQLARMNWGVRQFKQEIHEDDDAFIYVSGKYG